MSRRFDALHLFRLRDLLPYLPLTWVGNFSTHGTCWCRYIVIITVFNRALELIFYYRNWKCSSDLPEWTWIPRCFKYCHLGLWQLHSHWLHRHNFLKSNFQVQNNTCSVMLVIRIHRLLGFGLVPTYEGVRDRCFDIQHTVSLWCIMLSVYSHSDSTFVSATQSWLAFTNINRTPLLITPLGTSHLDRTLGSGSLRLGLTNGWIMVHDIDLNLSYGPSLCTVVWYFM